MTSFIVYLCIVWLIVTILISIYAQKTRYDGEKPLVIVDLNGLLIYRFFQPKLEEDRPDLIPLVPKATLLFKSYLWERPQSREFIVHLLDNYRVGVWSCATARNVDLVVSHMFGERRKELFFEWCQDQCTRLVDDESSSSERTHFIKELIKVHERFPLIDPAQIVIVDDSAVKMKNNKSLGVIVTEPWSPALLDAYENTGLMGQGGLADRISELSRRTE